MTVLVHSPALPQAAWVERHRWSVSLGLVLAVHLLALPLLLARQAAAPPPPPPPLLVDLAPPAPPPPAPTPPKPDVKPEPKPLPTPKPTPKPVVKTEHHPPPKPVALATPQPMQTTPPAPTAPVPEVANAPAEMAPAPPAPAAPAPPPPPASSGGPDSFEGRLMAALNRVKRYPALARAKHQTGVVWLRIVIDRRGHVLSSQLVKGSAFPSLNDEAVALAQRADPLPSPPDSLTGEQITVNVPVDFNFTS